MKRIVVGISGATGAVYGIRLLQILRTVPTVETHLVLSSAAKRTIGMETNHSVEQVEELADRTHRTSDIAASISSVRFVQPA